MAFLHFRLKQDTAAVERRLLLTIEAIRDTRPAQGKAKSGMPGLFLQDIAFIDLHSIGHLTAHRFVPSGVKEAHDLLC